MWADGAGLVCKLSTRTTILAAMNPRSAGHELASPLLSRFDMVGHPSNYTPHAHQNLYTVAADGLICCVSSESCFSVATCMALSKLLSTMSS